MIKVDKDDNKELISVSSTSFSGKGIAHCVDLISYSDLL